MPPISSTPEVSVITNISFDHKEFLGRTLGEIAFEKAGIIKKGIPVVASLQEPEAKAVIEKRAEEEEAELFFYGSDFSADMKKEDVTGITFDYSDNDMTIRDLALPLAGVHQMQNASVAIKAATIALGKVTETRGDGDAGRRSTVVSHGSPGLRVAASGNY